MLTLNALNENNTLAAGVAIAILVVISAVSLIWILLRHRKYRRDVDRQLNEQKLLERQLQEEEKALEEAEKQLGENAQAQVVEGNAQPMLAEQPAVQVQEVASAEKAQPLQENVVNQNIEIQSNINQSSQAEQKVTSEVAEAVNTTELQKQETQEVVGIENIAEQTEIVESQQVQGSIAESSSKVEEPNAQVVAQETPQEQLQQIPELNPTPTNTEAVEPVQEIVEQQAERPTSQADRIINFFQNSTVKPVAGVETKNEEELNAESNSRIEEQVQFKTEESQEVSQPISQVQRVLNIVQPNPVQLKNEPEELSESKPVQEVEVKQEAEPLSQVERVLNIVQKKANQSETIAEPAEQAVAESNEKEDVEKTMKNKADKTN